MGQAEVTQDLGEGRALEDGGEDLHRPAAFGAALDVHGEDAGEQLGPGISFRGSGCLVYVGLGVFVVEGGDRDDLGASVGIRSEDPVKADQVRPGRWTMPWPKRCGAVMSTPWRRSSTRVSISTRPTRTVGPHYTFAADEEEASMVAALIEHRANIDAADTIQKRNYRRPVSRSTPLHFAAQNGNREIVALLINAGANANAVKSTELHRWTSRARRPFSGCFKTPAGPMFAMTFCRLRPTATPIRSPGCSRPAGILIRSSSLARRTA